MTLCRVATVRAALCIAGLLAWSGASVAGESASVFPWTLGQANTPAAPPAAHRPRIDATVGVTSLSLQKLPADERVGGSPVGFFAGVGYFWTASLVTQIEFVSQAEAWNPDYALEYVAVPTAGQNFQLRTIRLKHNYSAGRWTAAQTVQIRRLRFVQPYFGAGAGIETQTVTTSRHESTRLERTLPSYAKSAGELPAELPPPWKTQRTIAFAEAGVKVFAGRRAYILVAWKFANTEPVIVSVGVGVELF
jgi:hypothetical protein